MERRRRAEHERARTLLREFAAAARRAGPAPERLEARGYAGARYARTRLRGWYLRRDRTAAVDVAGDFYLLSMPLGFSDRLRGARPVPSDPPLVLGASGRDGDSIALEAALERIWPGWRSRGDLEV